MRALLFVNNSLGADVTKWLASSGTDIAGVVLHPAARRREGDAILSCLAGSTPVFDAESLAAPDTLAKLRALKADIGVSVMFGYILKPEIISLFPSGCVNLHPSFLPWNKGAYPNVWPIVEHSPAGATLHYIDEKLDTGDVIARESCPVEATDTGATLYVKLESLALDLFRRHWPLLLAGRAPRMPQPKDGGTYHRSRDVEKIDEINMDKTYKARDLIDLIRARTFPPHRGAYFTDAGKKIFLELTLTAESAPPNDEKPLP